MVPPFFNLRNFLYMQIYSDFPTHECKKENSISILFSKICDSFLRQPCEREPEPYRGLHWPHSLPLRNAVEFWNDVNWIHLINKHYFQHLNCIGFTLCPWAVVFGLGSAYTNSQMWKYKYTNLEIQGQILPQSTKQRWWAEISWVDILPPFNS